MALYAATATPETSLAGALIAVAMIATLCYAFGCWLWPFGACRRCHGTGKRRSPFGRAFALCPRCHGDGRRLRIGRRIINSLREIHDRGTR
ncbi:Zn finger protein HypA/HybF involved in hydrogenase expression [Catenuloplanes nepalensis]|uniref:Zn finger protein HypA/HybF involved in hydrogenase expression n=1 Tax=Catenuloplanes nepalensis TaxID=587533 RepID=A0ABT9N3R1_9ACTN|nr:hypothetical protein [Catenuloplanes nepalensis]MDP9798311.1 Zn finger protein HypA/HybF involved in hydrogenase expression [Catenuloplanes nepalensis]